MKDFPPRSFMEKRGITGMKTFRGAENTFYTDALSGIQGIRRHSFPDKDDIKGKSFHNTSLIPLISGRSPMR